MHHCARTRAILFVLLFASGTMLAQANRRCPDWVSEFDQIQNSQILDRLEANRQQGWANLFSQSDPSALFDAGNETIKSLEAQIVEIEASLRQIDYGVPPNVNPAACENSDLNAASSYQCQIFSDQAEILVLQGTLKIARCVTGFDGPIEGEANPPMGPPIAGDPLPAGGSPSGSPSSNPYVPPGTPGGSPGSNPSGPGDSPQRVQDLLNALNTPTNKVKDLLDALNTPSDSPSAPNTSTQVQDLLTALNTNSSPWSDPLVSASTPDAPPVDDAPGIDWKQLSQNVVKQGIADSGEAGEKTVQFFDNLDGWNKLNSSDFSDQIDGVRTVAGGANDAFNTNPVSSAVTNQALGVIGSVANQEGVVLATADRAWQGEASPEDLDNSFAGLDKSIRQALMPGSQYVDYLQNKFQQMQRGMNNCIARDLPLVQFGQCVKQVTVGTQ
jgi:hypothetical protein